MSFLPLDPPVTTDAGTNHTELSRKTSPTTEAQRNADSELFKTEHLTGNLKGRAMRGGVTTIVSQSIRFALQTASTILLARLLAPAEFGLVAMVSAVTGFIAMFKDAGLSMATIQREHITRAQVSNLFWINLALSFVLMIATIAIAPLISWFYSEPRLTLITTAIAFTFLLSGLTVQHQALLRRQMRFTDLAVIQVVVSIISVFSGVIAAIALRNYWALIIASTSGVVANAACVWLLVRWIPSLPTRGSGVKPMLAFGGNLTGFSTITYFARNADNLLIGWWWGPASLGVYTKAYSLFTLPLSQVNGPLSMIAVPLLSRLQGDSERYKRAYLTILHTLTRLLLPWIAFAIVCADWIIAITLGEQWQEATPVFRSLAIVALVQPLSNTIGWLFVSQSRTGEQLRWGAVGGILTIVSFVLSIPYGIQVLAIAYSVSGLIIRTPLLIWWIGRSGPISSQDIYSTLIPNVLYSLVIGAFLLAGKKILWGNNMFLGLSISVAAVSAITLGAIYFDARIRSQVMDFQTRRKSV